MFCVIYKGFETFGWFVLTNEHLPTVYLLNIYLCKSYIRYKKFVACQSCKNTMNKSLTWKISKNKKVRISAGKHTNRYTPVTRNAHKPHDSSQCKGIPVQSKKCSVFWGVVSNSLLNIRVNETDWQSKSIPGPCIMPFHSTNADNRPNSPFLLSTLLRSTVFQV